MSETPTKNKKQRRSNPDSPPRHTEEIDGQALLLDLKTEQANLLDQLRSFVEDIFEDEDNMEEDTSDKSQRPDIKSQLFDTTKSEKCLTLSTTKRVLSLVRKTSHSNMITSIDKDALLRLQRILLRSLGISSIADLPIVDHSSEEGVPSLKWSESVDDLSNSLNSALCISYILSVAIDVKEIYAEETLMAIVDHLKCIIEDLFLRWFVECCKSKVVVQTERRRTIDTLLQAVNTQLGRLTDLFRVLPITESISSRMIFLNTAIVFAEVPSKGDIPCSALLVESLKMSAVINLQTIYATARSQQKFLLDEVLSSLSKLPSSRQGARQFRLPAGKSIQLVTALLLYLVQSSALTTSLYDDSQHDAIGDMTTLDGNESGIAATKRITKDAKDSVDTSEATMREYALKVAAANQTARYIINYLLERSMKSMKSMSTDEAPFKALVDAFVEDFVAVLPYPEWPAAEVMLRWIVDSMLQLVDNPKQGAQVKVSAVETLCNIACKIKATTMAILGISPIEGNHMQNTLIHLPKFSIPGSTSTSQLHGLQEMQQVILQYLVIRTSADETFRASLEFSVANWINVLSKRLNDPEIENTSFQLDLQKSRQHFVDSNRRKDNARWSLERFSSVEDAVVFAFYLHRLSFSGFLQMFDAILPRLLIMMDHSQTTLRTKTLRSFGRLSEIDPSILSMRQVQTQLVLRVSDSSPQVRDVSIDLLGKYISANPHAGAEYYRVLRERIVDTGVGVRKRVIKLFKELYSNHENIAMRVDIAAQLLYRLNDEEDSVQDLAYKTFEALWFTQFCPESSGTSLGTLSLKDRQDLKSRAAVIKILAADKNDSLVGLLILLITSTLERATDNKSHIQTVLKLLAQTFLDGVTSETEDDTRLKNVVAVKVLSEGVPTVFSGSQMESLLPYLQYGTSSFEQSAPSHVASAYRSVLPSLSSQSVVFLGDVQSTILAQLTKLPLKSLTEVVPALCTVVEIAGDLSRVSRTLKSCLARLKGLTSQINESSVTRDKQIVLLMHLIGLFGRYLKLEDVSVLRDCFAVESHFDLINLLITTILLWLQDTKSLSSSPVARAALQSLGNICINSPSLFQQVQVLKLSDSIMNSNQLEGKRILLGIYAEYLRTEQMATDRLTKLGEHDLSANVSRNNKIKRKKDESNQVDVGVLTGNTDKFVTDGISPSLMQRYLKQILAASLGLDQQLSIIAINLIRGIVGQGLANPRNCMPTIIALETSHDPYLKGVAADIHRNLNEKHESLIESCYIEGVKLAYRYQMRLNGNSLKLLPETSSIHTLYDIARNSRKGRQKFLVALIKGLDTNLDKLDSLMETDVKYAHFVAHNIACLRYVTNEEVHVVIHSIDKILSTTGAALQQLLDTVSRGANHEEEQLGKAAAIMVYGMSLRNQLKIVYNISEVKCLTFEPARLGSRADAKSAVKQPGVALVPDWSTISAPASARQRLDCIEDLFSRDEHLIHQRPDEPDVDSEGDAPEANDATFVEMARSGSAQ
ncbi:Sister chromatid cohesion protein mis4 [Taphrina deformans PYCC 5710]|uniref:Sister chromatid cohesion protein n=1 Tax=Taphrina deformans (strain PYCC 5710 / ATCC 11124 / CBS 356.35 / IMI 108563 / JCM 9778 / NBRC 8474) TaxID=1097556 RepID=R4XCX4_TAPDE|nr:Sister chromatid cohesion protein mis4 [Taphrina deformans PYCC 5710]|eukprot:CCG81175.1 Sister chromatid cohesion protein mis4 [Taphrina deformans PYCC 5710]